MTVLRRLPLSSLPLLQASPNRAMDESAVCAELFTTSNRGKSLRVPAALSNTIEPGTTILSERPLVVLKCCSQDASPSVEEIVAAVRKLDPSQRRAFNALSSIPSMVTTQNWPGVAHPLKYQRTEQEEKVSDADYACSQTDLFARRRSSASGWRTRSMSAPRTG